MQWCTTVLLYNNIGRIADNMPQYAHVAYFSISVVKKNIEMQFSFMTLYARIVVNVNRST